AILAGAGVEHANAAARLRAVAERWKIPVATTLRAKGVFPEDHPLSLGVFGYAGTHHARRALLDEPPDLLLVLGSGLNERDSMQWTLRPTSIIAVDLDPAVLGAHAPDGGIVGDCGAYLAFLLEQADRIDAAMARSAPDRSAWMDAIRATPRLQALADAASEKVPLHPARVVTEMRRAFPRDAILLVDSGAHRAFAGHYWSSHEPRTYVSATNLGPMGWAIPAATGVQCARPDRKVAVITGDGCMHMQGIEVATAARYGLPIVFVVLDNAALGNVWLRAHLEGPVPDALTRLPDLDWAGFGRSLGCAGETVRRPEELQPAFARALAARGPTVIDVKVEVASPTPVADWSAAVASWSYHE
ncbi:MAG: thiamine pyrophosphate-dependent enzyme, partial [Deltaproteobacteria bacterium]